MLNHTGQSLEEYLVNTVYFEKICAEHKLRLVEKKMFRDIFTGVLKIMKFMVICLA